MRVHYLQHVPFEGLGYIEIWLNEHGHDVSATHWFEADAVIPNVDQIDALIVMGGPMSVHDDYDHPWLRIEKTFITECIQAGKKVLGICLGAQLIANCLGERVYKANQREIGWFEVQPTNLCAQLSWFEELFQHHPTVFHWHGDKFDVPYEGGLHLLTSQANTNQAFVYGERVLGLQFHLEVTEQSLNEMLAHVGHELTQTSAVAAPFVQTETLIRAGAVHIQSCNRIMSQILQHWLVN